MDDFALDVCDTSIVREGYSVLILVIDFEDILLVVG